MKKLTIVALLVAATSFAQKDKCNCFDKEVYKAFVAKEQHQTVLEGEDAELTVLLSKKQKVDVLITYKITGTTANIENDIEIPKTNSFVIPAGKTQATIHIPTIYDNKSELDETFTIEILEGIKTDTKKKLNNNKLIRTRTIVDRNTDYSAIKVYSEDGVIKTNPAASSVVVRNLNGGTLRNQHLKAGIYLINATVNEKAISRTISID